MTLNLIFTKERTRLGKRKKNDNNKLIHTELPKPVTDIMDDFVDEERGVLIAMIMSMGGASVEDAAQALDDNNGDVEGAMAQLYGTKEQAENGKLGV
jgi:NACalpha-BTF3-like transcription factor